MSVLPGVRPDEAKLVAQFRVAVDGLVVVGGLDKQTAADENRLLVHRRALAAARRGPHEHLRAPCFRQVVGSSLGALPPVQVGAEGAGVGT